MRVLFANVSLKKISLNEREYEWADAGGLISNDEPTMLYLLLKNINPETRIFLSKPKYEIEKATQ